MFLYFYYSDYRLTYIKFKIVCNKFEHTYLSDWFFINKSIYIFYWLLFYYIVSLKSKFIFKKGLILLI